MNPKEAKQIYTIQLNEEQLRTIADCLEDVHRFLCGNTRMFNATSALPTSRFKSLRGYLELAAPLVNPDLGRGCEYDWAGTGCNHKAQRQYIASTYYLSREIRRAITLANMQNPERYKGIYCYPTLTCDESGDPISIVVHSPINKEWKM